MRSGNPTLNSSVFDNARFRIETAQASNTMTLEGTSVKAGILLLILLATASFTWYQALVLQNVQQAWGYALVGVFGGLIFAIVTTFKPAWSPYTAPIYAGLEGLFLGAVSAMIEAQFPGIAMQAVVLTVGILFTMLVAYRTGLVKATENFKLGVMAATGGIFLLYAFSMIMRLFFSQDIPFIHETGWIGIGFSVFVVIIASLNLVLDFDFIERGVEQGAPKYMEWYGAFGLMVTLVWLYLEILRLLAKLRSND